MEFVWDQTVATGWAATGAPSSGSLPCPSGSSWTTPSAPSSKACRHDPLVQGAYAECAEGYGFRIDACPPHDPQKKGIVESGVKYLKANFLPTRTSATRPT